MRFLKPLYLILRSAMLFPLGLLIPQRRPHLSKLRKILLIRVDRVGDMVLSTPFFANMRAACPDAEIVLLAQPFAKDLLWGNPNISRIIDWDSARRDKIIVALQQEHFDLAVDMHYDYELSTALLCRESAAEYAAGFAIAGRGAFFNIRVPATDKKHFLAETGDILKALGIEAKSPAPAIHVDPAAREAVFGFLAAHGLARDAKLAIIHPGGYYPKQRWPAENFALLADYLREKYNLTPCIIGSVGEAKLCVSVAKAMRSNPVLFSGHSLRELAALFEGAAFFTGNNSGPLHLAAAFGIAAVSTMGPTDPVRWQPFGQANSVVRNPDLALITVDEMITAVERRLG